ncbi:hypothetical protein PV327_006720 [Microctonus hyperodae]|uniref:Cytochrome b5 heme-binding domain-containing protein n=1 Tax=Microctonus hyperodae TaxID=165561 RepID=A0AA39F500_MICHY|nr:hypothetical protein PV327_006720 [Microctonus hyperodae]
MAELKQFTRDEVAKADPKLTRFILHDKVYDVTKFLNEHPGGEEVLLDHKGVDASEDFDDVGHSTDAQELMKKYLIGEIVAAERKNIQPKEGWIAGHSKNSSQEQGPSIFFYLWIGSVLVFLISAFFIKWN